jgi:quercetin dioxygenase-like cupin family protein
MAISGQVLDNPITGERITFHRTSADTGGRLLVIDLEVLPNGSVPGAHVHPHQEERFHVLEGSMKFLKGLRVVTAHAGDTVIVPAGTVHRFQNAGELTARARVEVEPALRMEELFETTVALAREGRTNARGMPRPLDLALFMREFEAEVRAPFVPMGLVRATLAPLAWVARRRALDIRYQRRTRRAPASRRDSRRPQTRTRHERDLAPPRSPERKIR